MRRVALPRKHLMALLRLCLCLLLCLSLLLLLCLCLLLLLGRLMLVHWSWSMSRCLRDAREVFNRHLGAIFLCVTHPSSLIPEASVKHLSLDVHGAGPGSSTPASIGSDRIQWRPQPVGSTVQVKPFLPGSNHIGIVVGQLIGGHDWGDRYEVWLREKH